MGLQTLNPVLDRELRQRSRSLRSMLLLTVFLGLMLAVMWLAYAGTETTANDFGDPISSLTIRVGRSMFEWVLAAELIILLFIVPGISAGAVAGERDRQTLVPLQVTLVGPWSIFWGKVAASVAFVLLLLAGSMPILAVPYLVGGISLTQVVVSVLTLGVIGLLLAVIGVSCSSIFRRTQTATLAAYGVVLALVLGTAILTVVLAVADAARGVDTVEPRLWFLYANPFLAIAGAAGELASPLGGPFSPIKQLYVESQVGPSVFVEGNMAFDERTGQPVDLPGSGGVGLWLRSIGAQALVAAVLAVPALRRLRAPSRELHS